jgi:hypothetical protein
MAIGLAVFTAAQDNPYSWMNQMFHGSSTGGGAGGMMGGGSTQAVVNPLMPYFGALFIVLVSLVIVGVVGLTYYLIYPQIPIGAAPQNQQATAPSNSYNAVAKTLTPEELKVVDALNAHGGKYLQKYITKETGLSRLKTHRIIARLAEREIVTLEKVGNTNQVYLANWLKQEK